MSIKLSTLASGSTGKIQSLIQSSEATKLKALGFISGHIVSVLRAGNPYVVSIDGMSIGISKEIADSVIIETN